MISIAVLAILAQDPAPVAYEPPGRPQEKLELTIREAVESALRNNLDLEIARYAPLIREAAIDSSWGAFDWTLYSGDSFRDATSPTASRLSGATALEQQILTTGLGVRQVTPLGISYDIDFSGVRTRTNSSFSTMNPYWSQSAGIELTFPTLRNFGFDAAYSTVVLARQNHRLGVREFETSLVDLVTNVEKSYWTLVFAQEDLKVKQQSLEVAKTLLKYNQERVNAGMMPRIEVTRAEAEVAQREEGIILAENAVVDAADALKILVDPKLTRVTDRDITIVTRDAPRSTDTPIDEIPAVERALVEARQNRPELAQLDIRQEMQKTRVEYAEDQALPKLDIVASARMQGLGPRFEDTGENTFTTDNPDLSIGMNFEFPVARWSAEGDYQQAELERRRLALDAVRTIDSVLLEIKRAVRLVKVAEKRQDATKKSVALAKEQYDAEEARQKNGDATMFEVLKALEDYSIAQANELRARIDYTNAKVDLDKASGTLLQKRGLLLEDQLKLQLESPRP